MPADRRLPAASRRRGLTMTSGLKLRLAPRDRDFFDLLERSAKDTVRSAGELEELAHFFPERRDLVDRLHARMLDSDGRTIRIVARASAMFVTPLEREDIVALATDLDEIVRAMHSTAALFDVYGVDYMRPQARRQTQLIAAAVTELSSAVMQLRRAESVSAYARTIREQVEQGDDVTRDGLRELFRENPTASELIRWKDLYDRLHATLELIRRAVARTEGIAAKTGYAERRRLVFAACPRSAASQR